MRLPKLKNNSRDREYKKSSENMRDKIVYEYLFNGLPHRELDKRILGLEAIASHGYQSMGILHYLGINDEFKGLFKGIDIYSAINILRNEDTVEHGEIISCLLRYSLNQYSKTTLDSFKTDERGEILFKTVGSSQYTDGVRIEKDFHDIFNPPDSTFYTKRGSARPIKVLFNNQIFDAEYRFEGQKDENIVLQSIRFKKELKSEFQKVFPNEQGEFAIQQGVDLNHFVFSFKQTLITVDEESYEDEYSEGAKAYIEHKVRERNALVIKKAKKAFLLKHEGKLFCEVCEFDFSEFYGARGIDFIEGHHKVLVSSMKEGEKTKVKDIAMLCANCHRMIHRKPLLTVEELAEVIKKQRNK